MKIFHVDVFSNQPLAGNGLTVVFPDQELSQETMQQIAIEFKQFETIFLRKVENNAFDTRIFTVEEELDFAGHPILGAAAVVHKVFYPDQEEQTITLHLNSKDVQVCSKKNGGHHEVVMNQGKAEWGPEVSVEWQKRYCEALNLSVNDLCKDAPMEVVSTGLSYLLVPIKSGLDRTKIVTDDFEALLAKNKAKFVYIFNMDTMEGRTWDNRGLVEDVATGSAAGPMGAYLYQHEYFKHSQTIQLHQGSFVGRPSVLKVSYKEDTDEILIAGDVKMLAAGELEI